MGIINRTEAFNVVRAEMKKDGRGQEIVSRWFKEDSRGAMEKTNINRNASRKGEETGQLGWSSRQVICGIMRD